MLYDRIKVSTRAYAESVIEAQQAHDRIIPHLVWCDLPDEMDDEPLVDIEEAIDEGVWLEEAETLFCETLEAIFQDVA